jgi:hypothetical protein
MSHTAKYKVNFTDTECVVKALQRMGFSLNQIEVHDEAAELLNYTRSKMGLKANVIIRKPNLRGNVNDFGVRVGEDGGEIYADGNFVNPKTLEQTYGVEKALKDADAMGYFTTEEVFSDGRIRLRINQ